ncbi:hypothetical protein GOP47_0016846 [Adiantum capillus-veneris]|uniref:Uncharacterized protein n=1 Tax=Adiantum capillus-veneris TaxID=13818 RepID=A0A9D4ZDD1_ADICA|nr:hypothetical protein GOP47_0016846 [Adiantum capillus-veneris]
MFLGNLMNHILNHTEKEIRQKFRALSLAISSPTETLNLGLLQMYCIWKNGVPRLMQGIYVHCEHLLDCAIKALRSSVDDTVRACVAEDNFVEQKMANSYHEGMDEAYQMPRLWRGAPSPLSKAPLQYL